MKIAQSSCKMKAIWAILVILVIGALVTCLSTPLPLVEQWRYSAILGKAFQRLVDLSMS